MTGPSKVQRYNDIVGQARAIERQANDSERKEDWLHAAKIWGTALDVATTGITSESWRQKINWCSVRQAFCESAARRAMA
jgi:hypothetical protein